MSGFKCPECGHSTDIFSAGGGETMANELGITFLGKIPIDPNIVVACDSGRTYLHQFRESSATQSFNHSIQRIMKIVKEKREVLDTVNNGDLT